MNDPIELFKNWLQEAEKNEPEDPGAFCLATADSTGKPAARMLLLKGVDERGFKFHTNAESRKGVEILENKRAAMCFYWKSTGRQVRIEGVIAEAPAAEADAYFASRPRERQIGAWASAQSRPLKSREELNEALRAAEKKFEGRDIPRPPYWKGFILNPSSIEFWQNDPARLHDRILYNKDDKGNWTTTHLYP